MTEILPGSRVLVFDWRLYKDDVSTPLTHTMRPGTVVSRYGSQVVYSEGDQPCRYPDLVDVRFDHSPGDVSREHFTHLVEPLEEDDIHVIG